MLGPGFQQTTRAAVVVHVDGVDEGASGDADAGVVAVLDDLSQPLRGSLYRVATGRYVAVFTAVPRAVEFGVALHGRLDGAPSGRWARVGVHVGQVREQDGSAVAGPAVRVAEDLAGRAHAGQTLLSAVVRDLVQSSGDHRVREVDAAEDGASGRAYVVDPLAPGGREPAVVLSGHASGRLQDALSTARLTLVLGRAGSGKTTLVRALVDLHPTVWLTVPTDGTSPAAFARELIDGLRVRVPGLPATLRELAGGLQGVDHHEQRARAETLAASVAGALADRLPRDLLVVVDAVERLAASPACVALVEALARNSPSGMHLVLVGRRDPGLRTSRLRATGGLVTLTDEDLRLPDDDVAAIVATRLGWPADHDDLHRLVRSADGHPETAMLAAAWARSERRPVPQGAAALARDLVRERDDTDRLLLDAVVALGTATPALLHQVTGMPVDTAVGGLLADGLVRTVGIGGDTIEIGSATRPAIRVGRVERRRLCLAAAEVLRGEGDVLGALRVLRAVDAHDACLDLVHEGGRRLLAEGGWPAILDAVGETAHDPTVLDADDGPTRRGAGRHRGDDAALAGMIGEAWRLAGNHDRSLAWFARALAATDPVPAWLAWRVGVLLHFRGELAQARELYARVADDGPASDRALVHAWHAAAAWIQSDIEACRAQVERAELLVRSHHDDQALAAIHTVHAMLAAVEGDRAANDRQYLRALEYAERAGDLLQLVRIHTNRGSRLLEEGDHEASLAELEIALRTADLSAALPIHAMALSNRGQVLRRLGRLDEAMADLTASRDVFERTGSRWVGYALGHLGELHSVRGERALALAAYEEALATSEPVGDVQGSVPALAGLALLSLSHDPDGARRHAERACAHPDSLGHTQALAALAEVALAQGDHAAATAANSAGMQVARQRRDRPGLATHLVLRARLATGIEQAVSSLQEARALWSKMGCPLEVARTDVAIAARDASGDSRVLAERAIRTLRMHGARAWAQEAEAVIAESRAERRAPFRVHLLGGFAIHHDGQLVRDHELLDPDARDLLAYLLVHAGTAGSSERIAAALWPHATAPAERLAAAGHRLARFLGQPPDHVDDGNAGTLADPSLVSSDLATFRTEAARGLAARETDADGLAVDHLLAAEAAYAGDLLEGVVGQDWITIARDDAAEVYLQVVTALVDAAEERGDHHDAARLLLRVVERDPHDEGAHLRLISSLERAGRRGESRRRYRTYAARMEEIGVEPAPFPDVTPVVRAR